MARTGTSWVGEMLAAGGHVGLISEPFNLAVPQAALRIPVDHWYTYLSEETEARFLPPLLDALEFRYPLWRQLSRCRGRACALHTLRVWRTFVHNRNRRPLIKDPNAIFSAEWFARRLESSIVVTVRHPVAVVSSWKRLGWSFDFLHLLQQPSLMRDWLGPFRAEIESALSPTKDLLDRVALLWHVIHSVVLEYRRRFPAFRIVLHEELSSDPLRRYAELYRSLGLPFNPPASAAVTSSSAAQNPGETPRAMPYETRIHSKANLDSWRHRVTAEEIARIKRVTEESASAFYQGFDW
jgi:hypothetical protein